MLKVMIAPRFQYLLPTKMLPFTFHFNMKSPLIAYHSTNKWHNDTFAQKTFENYEGTCN